MYCCGRHKYKQFFDGDDRIPCVLENFAIPNILFQLTISPVCGYELFKNYVKGSQCGCVDTANFYRTIKALVEDGLISHDESDIGDNNKKVYIITGKGRDYLDKWKVILEKNRDLINQFIKNIR